jgi:hypothetical protein
MTPLPLDPVRCDALSHGIDQLLALSGCTAYEQSAVLLAQALNIGASLPQADQISLIASVSGALMTLAAKPRLDA